MNFLSPQLLVSLGLITFILAVFVRGDNRRNALLACIFLVLLATYLK
mgnify:CR=1 FL=1